MMMDAHAIDEDIAKLVGIVRKGMVRITCPGRGAGAGTVWHSDGLILTNAHVAANRHLEVQAADGESYRASLIAADRRLDLAAISVNASELHAMELGSTTSMRPGELVFAMGYPLGVDGGLTAGVYIGEESWFPDRRGRARQWIMASLHLRPGHSGGPMFDANGSLIGINTVMRGPDVGVAIPIDVVKRFLRKSVDKFKPAA
jgi:serine protease Do